MRALVTLMVLLGIAGCGGGPDTTALRNDVGARLEQALPAGTVTLSALERRGSQADFKAPAGETRRVVYFDAELKLQREFDFGAWDGPGVSGMLSALGAGPKGISGLTSGGNKAGDVIRAHGTVLYKRDGERWAVVASGGFRPVAAPAYATSAPQSRAAAILDAMRKVIESVPRDAAPAQRIVIEEELSAAYAAIRSRLARVQNGYGIAAGPEHGQYLRFAQALAAANGGARMVPLITAGGEENLRLLRDGKVALALAQGDSALDAYEGRGNFAEEGAQRALRALGSLYPEPVHVLVRASGGPASMGELRGRRVAIGLQGSASRTTAVRVLQAHGLRLTDVKPLELSIGDALTGLQRNQVDAVIQVIGMPADSIRDAIAAIPLRLLPLSEAAVATLVGAKSGYFAFTVPPGAYSGQKNPVRTVATAALLLAGTDLSDTEITTLTRLVYETGRDFAARGSAQGTQVGVATAREGLSIPIHVAAAKALDAIASGAPAQKPRGAR